MRRLLPIAIVALLIASAGAIVFVLGQTTNVFQRTITIPPTSTPGALFVCEKEHGGRSATWGAALCLKANEYAIGDTITVTTGNWGPNPLKFYLLPEDQADLTLMGMRRVGMLLGEVPTSGGGNTFEFVLPGEFEAENGDIVTFSPGDRAHVMVVQEHDSGALAAGTSFHIR